MKALLKSLFRKPVQAAPVKAAPRKRALSLKDFERVMQAIGPKPAEFRKFAHPGLPPGVRPARTDIKYHITLAQDAAGNEEHDYMALDDAPGGSQVPIYQFLNSSPLNGTVGLTFPGFAFLSSLQQISEFRAPCEVTSTEMTREWLKVRSKSGGDKTDKIKQITERMEELKLQEKMQTVCLYDCQFGGGFLFWEYKGQESDEARQLPVLVKNIKKGSLKNVTPVEPYWCTPWSYNADRPERFDFYVPQSWFLMGRKTHVSRLSIVITRPLPDLLKPSYNFMGIALAQLMFPYVERWLRTVKSVNDLISIFSILNLNTTLGSTLEEDGENGPSLEQRMKLFTVTRDNRGVLMTDKDTEELKLLAVPLSGLDKLQAQAQEHMAAPSHIPLIKLFGLTPAGLGATGEGEIQVWYDWIAAQQQHALNDHVNRALEIIQMDLFGAVDDDITFEWVTLAQPTPKEESELRKADAERDDKYVAMGAIDPNEVRAKLQSDPNSGYDNLVGDAPGPPEMQMAEMAAEGEDPHAAGAEHQHAAGEADKDREHEANENDKDRKHDMAMLKAAPKPKVAADGWTESHQRAYK